VLVAIPPVNSQHEIEQSRLRTGLEAKTSEQSDMPEIESTPLVGSIKFGYQRSG